MQPQVVILGGGPSAAYAFKACKDFGIVPTVFANKRTFPYGAFWLHWLPKTIAPRTKRFLGNPMEIRSVGTAVEYARKMWGTWMVRTSFPEERQETIVYNPAEGLKELWKGVEFRSAVILQDSDLILMAKHCDLLIQTFPSEESKQHQPKAVLFPIETK